jgi:hypothetical protein
MKTLQTQYNLIKEGKGHKDVFLKEAKRMFPNGIRKIANFDEAANELKRRGIISENYVDLQPINNISTPKQGFENAFSSFLSEEAKAIEKKVSKEVEEDASHGYDTADKDNQNNLIFDQFQNGVYFEAKQAPEKDLEDIKKIVQKNLEKDPIYYTKNGMFGVEAGYTKDAVALVPKEVKSKDSSGYGDATKKDFPEGEVGTGYLELKENKMISLLNLINENEEGKKPKKVKKETVESKLSEIEKAGKITTLEMQIEAIDEIIESKNQRISMVTEDDNLSQLVDKKKMKEMQREVKDLEKRKAKMEKLYEKMCGKSYTKEEVIDEQDEVSWNEKNNPSRGAAGERDPKKVGQSTSAYAVNK